MPNTYTQLYIQPVFAVKGRECQVTEAVRERLQQYVCGIVSKHQHKPLAIYCMPDHLHLLVGLQPSQSIADLVRDIKSSSTTWLNAERLLPQKFQWQQGYGAFSYARSQLDAVIHYIQTQPAHHDKRTFQQEYRTFLQKFGVEYDERYLFD
ncbi:MAG: IS200/IS605 family transposase [Hymenobacter sp.]|nr:MAG: IS200/IS605 family transposase [Hymenobacter sp.]